MRIKSNFRDYYDGIQVYGADDLLYLRYPKQVEVPFNLDVHDYRWREGYSYRCVMIGFCGKIYCGYKFFNGEYGSDTKSLSKYLYTREEVIKFYNKMGWTHSSSMWSESVPNKIEPAQKDNLDAIKECFLKYQTPILVCDHQERKEKGVYGKKGYHSWNETITTANHSLEEFDFQRVFSPQLAYQEIRMFMSNMASPEKPIPKIDDVTMAEAKGFDKFSFRKDKSNKKRK